LVIESDDPATPVKFVEVLATRFGMLGATRRTAAIATKIVATSILASSRATLM
jgi:hypothetical protein